MTCIVGIVKNDTVWIGGDSAGVAGLHLTPRAGTKVFRNGPFVMGFTSSFRMGQLLRFSLKPPPHHPDVAIDRFMVTCFIDGVRNCLKDGGFASKDKESEAGGCFLVGYQARLFIIDSDYQVGQPIETYAAVGCGSDIALGALHALNKSDLSAKERIEAALNAAARFSAGVAPPLYLHPPGKIYRWRDSMMCLHDDLARALETLELLGTPGRHDFLVMAALETGGYFKQPERANNWDSQLVEIRAHGIYADATELNEAIRNWMLVAARQVRVQQQVARAEHLLRQPGTDPDTLRAACRTILSEGRVAALQNAARATLADLDYRALPGNAPEPLGDCRQSPAGPASKGDARI